jgi:hypothetical protein
VFVGGFLLYLGFHVGFGCCGYVVSYGFFMWASWVAHVYTSCVLRGALRFFNEIFLLIKKKKKGSSQVQEGIFSLLFW